MKLEKLYKLTNRLVCLGWYGGKVELLKLTLVGAFEGFSGRASETWEHLYEVIIQDVPDIGITGLFMQSRTSESLEDFTNRVYDKFYELNPEKP